MLQQIPHILLLLAPTKISARARISHTQRKKKNEREGASWIGDILSSSPHPREVKLH